mmetsp:Transcript_9252/g.13527  ORF Transcript_9252/g.13527 Transcript_9252/m.13527 type:complete len:110 (-) Transcript_9252:2332-2661(-)
MFDLHTCSPMCTGLQNYMAYTQSVLYARSGGEGKASSLAVATVTGALFVVGPFIASYIPRCMAGTLLLHVGIDLFLEGVYDSKCWLCVLVQDLDYSFIRRSSKDVSILW